jgi:Cu-Zn family superoxide dismutase
MGASTSKTAVVVYRTGVKGTVVFQKIQGEAQVVITCDLTGLTPGKHGLHIHEYGDLREGCKSACAHYNPDGKKHGDLDDFESHVGDLGNLVADRYGHCKQILRTYKFDIPEIIGRCLIIHAQADDLGKGDNADSRITGNSGDRIACEIIGLAAA